jgi:hypothetical protein
MYADDPNSGFAAGLVDTLRIPSGSNFSYTDALTRRQMPQHELWSPSTDMEFNWPPNVLPSVSGAFLGDGSLDPSFSVSPSSYIIVQQGGWLDFVVTQVGSDTAGTGLLVAVQT